MRTYFWLIKWCSRCIIEELYSSSWCQGQQRMPPAFQRVVFQCLVRDTLDWTNVDWVTLFKSWTDGVYTQTLCMWGEKIYWDMLNSSIHPSFPADEDTLCHFAATLAMKGLHHRTILSPIWQELFISSIQQARDLFSA